MKRSIQLCFALLILIGVTPFITSILLPCRVEALPPGVPVPPGAPPPPGSGPNPPPLIPGDLPGSQRPPATGRADRTTGSRFGTVPETVPAPNIATPGSYPYPTGTAAGRPQRTLRSNPTGGYTNGSVPSIMIINDDGPQFGRTYGATEDWLTYEDENFPLPSVKPFCKILVILGVVFATVKMIIASYSVTMGHKDSGKRVIGTAAGLILLLMGYSIYKVVMINALRISSPGPVDTIRSLPALPRRNLNEADTPGVPGPAAGSVPRSNMQVQPFLRPR